MTSIYFYELVLLFFIFYHNFFKGNVDKGYFTRNSFSRNEFLNFDSIIYHDVSIFNISHTNHLSSSDHFYPFNCYFYKYSFLYTVFLMICFR